MDKLPGRFDFWSFQPCFRWFPGSHDEDTCPVECRHRSGEDRRWECWLWSSSLLALFVCHCCQVLVSVALWIHQELLIEYETRNKSFDYTLSRLSCWRKSLDRHRRRWVWWETMVASHRSWSHGARRAHWHSADARSGRTDARWSHAGWSEAHWPLGSKRR